MSAAAWFPNSPPTTGAMNVTSLSVPTSTKASPNCSGKTWAASCRSTAQNKPHLDGRLHLDRLSVKQRRGVDPLLDRVDSRFHQHRMPTQNLQVADPAVGAKHAHQLH